MQKVQFNYEVWKNHPEREKIKLETRHGDQVTEFTDSYVNKAEADKPLIGIVRGRLCTWGLDGMYMNQPALHDLFMIMPKEPEMWVNVYKFQSGQITCGNPYESAASAMEALIHTDDRVYIGTFKLV